MSDIPEDIRKAAEKVIDRGYDEGMVEALERALMNEREKNAAIAEKHGAKDAAREIRG